MFWMILFALAVGAGLWWFEIHGPGKTRRAQSRQKLSDAHAAKIEEDQRRLRKGKQVWPPRRPDDWGREAQERHHRDAQIAYQHKVAPPPAPLIPSWEAYHAAEQAKHPLQIRWAQNEHGEWVKIQWGNASQRPENCGPLPVVQSMLREDNREWVWVLLGPNPSLDWQRGPSRTEQFVAENRDGSPMPCLRPCGSPAHQDAPAPIQPADEHGSSDWQTPDDLAGLGAVRPRR